LITVADVLAFLHAYPLYGLMGVCPDWTLWAAKTWLGPVYRLLHPSEHRLVAERISQWLGVPLDKGQALAHRWMHHYTRTRCYHLSTLLKKPPSIGDESIFGLEHLDRALGEERGVLLISLHCFAIIPALRLLRRMNYPILTVRATPQQQTRSQFGKRYLLPRLLQLHARVLTESEGVASDDPSCALLIARRLRQGGMVHIAPDTREPNTFRIAPRLNRKMPPSSGVLDLARLCRCPVLPLVAAYTDNGIRIELGAPLDLRYEGTSEECAHANLPILAAHLERQVRANPDQWTLWVEH